MKRIFYSVIAAFLLTACAVQPEQPPAQNSNNQQQLTEAAPSATLEPSIVLQDELMNEPPENPRFIVAKAAEANAVEKALTESIKQQLQQLGYVEAQSRDDANVVVWYSYESEQTGVRDVGQATDVWGEQLPIVVESDVNAVLPNLFRVQLVSLQESRFPQQVIPIWKGEWSSSVPSLNMVEFTGQTLAQVFDQYQSEQTQNMLAAFRQARERKVKQAINAYIKMVMYRVQKNWDKPRYNVKGKTCEVKIVQSAVGEIQSHQLLACDKDRRFRRSIEKAIKASSPLPLPQEHLFDRRELVLVFQG